MDGRAVGCDGWLDEDGPEDAGEKAVGGCCRCGPDCGGVGSNAPPGLKKPSPELDMIEEIPGREAPAPGFEGNILAPGSLGRHWEGPPKPPRLPPNGSEVAEISDAKGL